mgnify:CR=1 FL=1
MPDTVQTPNWTLLTDLYQLTMMQGYYETGIADQQVVFDLFYRTNPHDNSFSITAGLQQAIEYIENIHFAEEEIAYLKSLNLFSKDFLTYLEDFRFTGDLYAIPEGTVVFPMEPLVRVHAPIIEAQFLETALLNIINHQSLIATKASRVAWAAKGDGILEFGLRRAQGPDAGTYGARAAIIGGCTGTSNVLAGQMFDIPVKGTHAHSWVMSFPDEITAFREYAKLFPDNCILLVDTYDTIRSGVPNAIQVFKELQEQGIHSKVLGIRLDSGDLAYLSKKAREMLDAAGFPHAIISASGDLDEYVIRELKLQGSDISLWGVGTRLITSKDCPAFGGVYKLSAHINEDGVSMPKMKISDNPAKITNPGIKKVFRIYEKNTGKLKADLIALEEETIDINETLHLFDPDNPWKEMYLAPGTYTVKELLVPIFNKGKLVYSSPSTMEIRQYCQEDLATLWSECRQFHKPHIIPVDLSQKLYDLRQSMIDQLVSKKPRN